MYAARSWGYSLDANDFVKYPGTPDEYLELFETYIRRHNLLNENLTFTLGRQQLGYGDRRFFGPGKWGNTHIGDEIDLIIDHGINIDLAEIKASHSYRPGFQKTLDKYQFSNSRKVVVYQGDDDLKTGNVNAMNCRSFLLDFL